MKWFINHERIKIKRKCWFLPPPWATERMMKGFTCKMEIKLGRWRGRIEKHCSGGSLGKAGKTFPGECLTFRFPGLITAREKPIHREKPFSGTLIVVPAQVILQWKWKAKGINKVCYSSAGGREPGALISYHPRGSSLLKWLKTSRAPASAPRTCSSWSSFFFQFPN